MSNIYYSNTVIMNKRDKPIPASVSFNYEKHDQVNKF
jgi:hypothetical protein